MPKHIYIIMAVTFAFFFLLWLGMVILRQTPTQAFVATLLTLVLLGFGINFSRSTLRNDHNERD